MDIAEASLEIELDQDIIPASVESSIYDFVEDSSEGSQYNEISQLINNLSDEIRDSETSEGEGENTTRNNSDEEDSFDQRENNISDGNESENSDIVEDGLTVDKDNLEGNTNTPEDLYDILNKDPQWTENFSPIHVKQFQGSRRSKLPHDFDVSKCTPIDYLKLFLCDEVFRKICENTNKYFLYMRDQKRINHPNYSDKHWESIEPREMKAFFGLAILFGIHSQPRYRNYWSKNPLLGNKAVQDVMTLRRYQKISEYLHVSDRASEHPRGHPQHDKLGKVRWLLDHVQEMFPKYKHPERCQSIDEGTIAFTGRCSFIQYNKSKPQKRGIKTYIRTCATTAYCQQFAIYLGKESTEASKNGIIFDTVWDLVKTICGKYHCVYFDNWYTSIPLLRFLYSQRTYSCGTIRQNKKLLPNKVKTPGKIHRGQFITLQSKRLGNLTCTVWKDTKEVRFASTCSKPEISTHGHRRIGGRHVQVTMPSVATMYAKYMGGVDKLDRYISRRVYGTLGHGARKIWRHILWYIVNLCIANAWILYKLHSTRKKGKRFDQMEFRLELAEELINRFNGRQRVPPEFNVTPRPVLENLSGHVLVHSEAKRPKRCKTHCTLQPNKKPRRETIYMCQQCNQHQCPDCFRIVHLPNNNNTN